MIKENLVISFKNNFMASSLSLFDSIPIHKLDNLVLRNIASKIENDSKSFFELLCKLHAFVGQQINHDLKNQVLKLNKDIPRKSLSNIILRSGRCGVKARVLADLLVNCGYNSGIVVTGHHVLTYLEIGGQYFILDADLFKPGTIPFVKQGKLPTLEDYLNQSKDLDSFQNNTHVYLEMNKKYIFSNLSKTCIPSSSLNSAIGRLQFYTRRNSSDYLNNEIRVKVALPQIRPPLPFVVKDGKSIKYQINWDIEKTNQGFALVKFNKHKGGEFIDNYQIQHLLKFGLENLVIKTVENEDFSVVPVNYYNIDCWFPIPNEI